MYGLSQIGKLKTGKHKFEETAAILKMNNQEILTIPNTEDKNEEESLADFLDEQELGSILCAAHKIDSCAISETEQNYYQVESESDDDSPLLLRIGIRLIRL